MLPIGVTLASEEQTTDMRVMSYSWTQCFENKGI